MSVAVHAPEPPLVVDLDGTLLRGDVLIELLVELSRSMPSALCALPVWLLRGRAVLKRSIASRVTLNPSALSYEPEVLDFVRSEHHRGRTVILATAADAGVARVVATHLGVFDDILGSDGVENLKGATKLQRVQEMLGGAPFDYVGDASADLPLWRAARHALLVGDDAHRARFEGSGVHFARVFHRPGATWSALLRSLRPHQWAKNVLVALPLVLAHQADGLLQASSALLAFACFCLCASAVYLLNDIIDVSCDRLHKKKRLRPFASGELPLELGLVLSPLLLVASFAVALTTLPLAFVGWLAVYAATTTAYSLRLKREVLLDVTALSGLYIVRLVAGAAATGVPISVWLYTFGLFFFVSLALAKRAAELAALGDREEPRGRGYQRRDLPVVIALGIASGLVSVLVFALYLTSRDVTRLYARPDLLWGILPILLYWVGRVWILASRGEMHEDPVEFALRDRTSYVLLVGIAALLGGAL